MRGLDLIKQAQAKREKESSDQIVNAKYKQSEPRIYESDFNKYEITKGEHDLTNSDYMTGFENPNTQNLDELRAYRQGNLDMFGKGVARAGLKAAVEIAKMPGFIGGAVTAPFVEGNGWETATNNGWIKALNNFNEQVNTEALPVYVKEAVTTGNLWDNITSLGFWSTEGADGIGYIASMFAPGAAFKALGLGHKAMGLTAKGLKLLNGEQKMAGAVRQLTNMGITANKFDVAGTALANSLFEASAEAGGAIENFDKQKDYLIDKWMSEDPTLTPGQAAQKFEEQKGNLGRDIFVSNMGILLIPNLIQSKMIWGKAGNKLLSKVDDPSLLKKLGNRSKDILGATASEGFLEEAGQSTVENMFTKSAEKGNLTNNFTKDFNLGELADNYLETISSVDGQKAMFLGAFLGGGMSAYHGAKQDKSDRTRTNSLINFSEGKVNNFNKILETEIYKKDTNGETIFKDGKPELDAVKVKEVVTALQYTEAESARFDEAVKNGDTKVVQELKDRAITQLAMGYITQGPEGIQALKQYLETISQSEDIVGMKDPKEIKQMISKAVSQATYMQDQLQAYQDFSRELINIDNSFGTKEDIESYYNALQDTYIVAKGEEFNERAKLKDLKEKQKKLINDIGEDNIQIRTDKIVDEDAVEDMFKYESITDPRIEQIRNEIKESEEALKEIDKFVNKEIWDAGKTNEDFKEKVKENEEIRKKATEAELVKIQELIQEISNTESEEDLNKIKSNNPEIKKIIEAKRTELKEIKRLQQEAIDEENRKLKAAKDAADPSNQSPDPSDDDTSLDGDVNKDPSNDPPIDNNDNSTNKDLDADLSKTQPGAKVISTNRKTNKVLSFISDLFMKYERNGKDKSKDKVGFKINNSDLSVLTDDQKKAVKMVEYKDFSNLEFLYDHLPINGTFNNNSEAPLETLSPAISNNKDSLNAFKNESLPLRKSIIDALANGSDIKDISTNIVKQFPGQLKVQPQIIDADGKRLTPENSIRELQFFNGMSPIDMMKEFAKRAYFVHYDGQLTSVNDLGLKKSGKVRTDKGVVFLEIPQNNGKPYMLKLNFKRISEDKADGIYELIKILSNTAPSATNPTPALVNLQEFLATTSDEIRELILGRLSEEITLMESLYPNASERTVDKLLDLLVHQKSKNVHTMFKLDVGGNLILGTLASKTLIKKSELDTPESKAIIVDFLKNKRHNILITKDKKATFNNPTYVKYLLDNNILSTNAVVNEDTFQGYSNIYLNKDVKVDNQVKSNIKSKKSQVKSQPQKTAVTIPPITNKGKVLSQTKDKVGELAAYYSTPPSGENLKGTSVENTLDNFSKYLTETLSWSDFTIKFNGSSSIEVDFKNGTKITAPASFLKIGNSQILRIDMNDVINAKYENVIVQPTTTTQPISTVTKEDVKIQVDNFDVTKLDRKTQMKAINEISKVLNMTLSDEQRQMNKDGKTAELLTQLITKAEEHNENIDGIIEKCNV